MKIDLASLWMKLRWRLLAIAMVQAALYRLFFPTYSSDINHYLMLARSLLLFDRPVQMRAPLADLSQIVLAPFVPFPAGYSAALAAMLTIIPDELWAILALDWMWIAIALVSWFVITGSIALSAGARLLLWSAWAFACSPFHPSGPADGQAVALLSAAIALCARGLARNRPFPLHAAAAGALIGLAALTRYAYWPLVPVVPAALALVAWRRRRPLGREIAVCALLGGLGVASLAAWNYFSTGHATFLGLYYGKASFGFNFSHLDRLYPFPLRAVGFDRAVKSFLTLGREEILLTGSAALFVLFAWWAFAAARDASAAPDASMTARAFVFTAGGLVVAGTLATLAAKSIRYPLDSLGITAVEVDRYWLPTLAPIGLVLVDGLARRLEAAPPLRWRAVPLIIAFLLLSYLNYRPLVASFAKRGFAPPTRSIQNALDIGRKIRRHAPTGRPVYLDVSPFADWGQAVAGANAIPIARWKKGATRFSTTAPVTLVVGLASQPSEDKQPGMREFLMSRGARKLGDYRRGSIPTYAIDLAPGTYEINPGGKREAEGQRRGAAAAGKTSGRR